jgi:uncharacterized membrane protein
MISRSIIYGLGALGLGLVGLAFQDFALQWQPVSKALPLRTLFANLSALLLIAGGIAVLLPRTSRWGGLGLGLMFALWVLALKLPGVIAAPQQVVVWLGLAEITAMAVAGLMIFEAGSERSSPGRATSLRVVFGLCALVFGLSHIVYAGFTAGMVPKWIPQPLFWAYATGAGHALAGLAMVSGVRSRLAAMAEAAMCGAFVMLLHAPRVAAQPGSHAEWTMLFVATLIAGSAWTMRWAPEGSFGRGKAAVRGGYDNAQGQGA